MFTEGKGLEEYPICVYYRGPNGKIQHTKRKVNKSILFGDLVYLLRDEFAPNRTDVCVTVNDMSPSLLTPVEHIFVPLLKCNSKIAVELRTAADVAADTHFLT